MLPVKEFDTIMEELDDLEDVRLYDEAKKRDTGERILFADYLKTRDTEIPDYCVVLSKTAQKQLDKLPDSVI